jgi:serine/threonine protein kinase/thioredoxin-like negative regulator of GroEL
MTLASGTRLGPYEILSPLGAGGMGEVYRARDSRLERIVALKALPRAFSSDPERLARFDREAKLLASLNHPNIGAIYGLEESGGAPYLVLEFIDGESLATRLQAGPLTVRETVEAGVQIASAIEAAHARGVVHRDLKPANIMFTAAGLLKVLDFGLAKAGGEKSAPPVTATAATTGAGVILGTAAYMSPEQARGKPVDGRADIWSLGCVLFECLTGRRPFSGESASDVIAKVLEHAPEWSLLPASVPPRLLDLVRRCLKKDPAERPRDVGDLRSDLAAILAELSSSANAQPAPLIPSLAVLYFENLSSDAESDYFCAGMTEDILTDLSKIKGLHVASRTAVARFRGTVVDVGKVAADLGVGAVLEGSVRRAGDRVRITAQLINAADGFHLWAERYDRTLRDVFAVQEEIASSIASALRVALTPAESKSLQRGRPEDVLAYDLYLRGRDFYAKYTPEALRYAIGLFEQAVATEPGYALAWAGIADCCGQMVQWGIAEDVPGTIARGLEAARRSIALDPRLAEGHKAEALVLRFADDPDASRVALLRAIEANPRFTPALMNLGVDGVGRGDLAGAERLCRRVVDIDPQDAFAIAWLASLALLTGRTEDSLATIQRLRRVSSDPMYVTVAYVLRSAAEMRRGDLAAVKGTIREGRAEGADPVSMRVAEAEVAARSDRRDEALRLLDEAEASPGLGSQAVLTAARAAVRCGAVDIATRLLTRPMLLRQAPVLVRLDPELHSLLERAEFGPRRSPLTLVWPLEAPPLEEARRLLFAEVRTETGRPRPGESFTSAP